jgi:hypothetical protein
MHTTINNRNGEKPVNNFSQNKWTVCGFFLLSLAACGRTEVDPEFADYITAFEQDSVRYNNEQKISYDVKFGDTKGQGAKCTHSPIHKEVLVNQKNWDQLDKLSRLMLLYHEFGHCSLGRSHNNEMRVDQTVYTIPRSIMNQHPVTGLEYQQHEDDYLKELFKKD